MTTETSRRRGDGQRRCRASRCLARHRLQGTQRSRAAAHGDSPASWSPRRGARLPREHARPQPARGPHLHRRRAHHRQLRAVHDPGHARRRGRARRRPDLGAALRRARRPHPRATLSTHPASTAGSTGIIVTGRTTDPRSTLGRDLPIPIVYARARSDHADDLSLLHDDQQGAGLAIRHLLATGRRASPTSPGRIDTWPRAIEPPARRRRSRRRGSASCSMSR